MRNKLANGGERPDESKGWRQHAGEALIAVLVAFAMLWAIPKLVPSSDAMTHLTAKAQAGLVGGFYPSTHRNDVTVVVIDDLVLSRLEQGWPVPYATHGRWLRNLAKYQPRAIFLDVMFVQARKDETLPALVSALCGLRDLGIPVFLAALPDPDTGVLAVRPDLKSPEGEKPCFSLVGVTYEKHKIDRLVWTYPLWDAAGQESGAFAGGPSLARSAALAMAQDAAQINVVQRDEPMALTWGVNNLDQQRFAGWCRQAWGGLAEIVPPFVRAWRQGDDVYKPVCPYQRSLTMSSLRSSSEVEERELQDLLGGRFVMIGTNLGGGNDMVTSPVHGDIPGVFMHAMALDNLLTYNGRYKRALEWELPPAGPLFLLGVVIVLAAHALRIATGGFASRVRTRLSKKWLRAWDALARRIQPPTESSGVSPAVRRLQRMREAHWPRWRLVAANLLNLLVYLVLKALSIALTSAVIMLLVVAVQKVFDVGTLPIVDLVVMALVAEWLGWTALVSRFMFHRKRKPQRVEPLSVSS
jgi:CHASE2 domain-containing sensor protein